MLLTNNFSLPVYWRTFNTGDTVYIVGHRDGWIAPGGSTEYSHPHGTFQLEVRSGATGHPFLMRAGAIFSNDDELIVTPEGRVSKVEDAVMPDPDPEVKRDILIAYTMFFDRLNFDTDTTDEISSTYTLQTTTGTKTSAEASFTSGNETSTSGGAGVSGGGKVKEVSVGLKLSGTSSSKVTIGTARKLSAEHNITAIQTSSQVHKMPVVLKARRITAVHMVWERSFRTGRSRVGNQVFPWEITIGIQPSVRVEQYDGIAAMPPAVFDDFSRKNPNAAGIGFLRKNLPFIFDGNGWLGLFVATDVQPHGGMTGTVFGNPFAGSWHQAFGDFQFTRTVTPQYTQFYYARVVSELDIAGYFREIINGVEQNALQDWRMARSLALTGNGLAGRFLLSTFERDGSFAGTAYGDQMTGSWNQMAGTIAFTRTLAAPGVTQRFTGRRTGFLRFEGNCEQLVNGAPATSFNWSMRAV
jgi:hypothetical protein